LFRVVHDRRRGEELFEDHGFIAIDKHPFVQHQLQRPAQYRFLYIPTRLGHVIGTEGVANVDHVLFDDGTLIEIVSHEVRGGADQLYAAIKRLPIGGMYLARIT